MGLAKYVRSASTLRLRGAQLSNDSGIDGIIDQDSLGLDRIYVQAKRMHRTVRFSQGARDYAESVSSRVILIDGAKLSELMINCGVGVPTKETYVVVEVDEDYFE